MIENHSLSHRRLNSGMNRHIKKALSFVPNSYRRGKVPNKLAFTRRPVAQRMTSRHHRPRPIRCSFLPTPAIYAGFTTDKSA